MWYFHSGVAEVDVDRVHRFRLRADERDRLESAEPDDSIEQDRLGQRRRRFRLVFKLQLPQKLERSELTRLLHSLHAKCADRS